MNQIQELREKRAKAWDAAKAFLDTKRGNDGLLSAEDVATYDKMEADVVNLGKEIDRLERQSALDAELNKPTADPLTNKPVSNGMDAKSGRASDEYKKAFWNVMRAKNPRYDVVNALQIGTDSEGGYLAPDEFERVLIDSLEEENIFRKLAHLMDAETWMNAQKAVELGFADGMLSRDTALPEDIPLNSYQFSRRAVTNSLLSKIPKTEHKHPSEPLYQRLNLLKK